MTVGEKYFVVGEISTKYISKNMEIKVDVTKSSSCIEQVLRTWDIQWIDVGDTSGQVGVR